MKTIYNPLMRFLDTITLFILSIGAFVYMVVDFKALYEIFGFANLVVFYLVICFFAIPMFIGAVFIYKHMSIYVKTDGKNFYAYRYPNVLLYEVDVSKPVYYKIGKTGYNSKYIVFSNDNFEFRELSKKTTTFSLRYDENKIIFVRYDTNITHYFPLCDWIEVEDRTGMLPEKQVGNTECIILKFPKFAKIAFVVFSLIALVYIPIVMPFGIPMCVLLGAIVCVCLTGLLCCLLWKIEFYDNRDYFVYNSFIGRKMKVNFNDCEKIVWSNNSGFFRIITVKGKKIHVSSMVSNYEMLRRKLLQNGAKEYNTTGKNK